MNYIVKAFDRYNCEIIVIERDSLNKAKQTARYWKKRGASWTAVYDEEYNLYFVKDENEIEYKFNKIRAHA